MTTLTKDEVIAIADQTLVDPLCGVYMTTIDELEAFAHLCRADLVAEVDRLKAACDKFSEAEMLGKKGYVFP